MKLFIMPFRPVISYIFLLFFFLFSCVYGSTALRTLTAFSVSYTVGRTSWTGNHIDARPLPTHRKTQTE
jgi:hypothetical protein